MISYVRRFALFIENQIKKTLRHPARIPIIIGNFSFHLLRRVCAAPLQRVSSLRGLNFLKTQIIKTIRNPARVPNIIMNYMRYLHAAMRFRLNRGSPSIRASSFTVPPQLCDDLQSNYVSGIRALGDLQIGDAIRYLAHAVMFDTGQSEIDYWMKREAAKNLGVALHHGLGRLDEAVCYWREAVRFTRLITQNYDIPELHRAQIYDDFWSTHIGHTAILGVMIKRQILAGEADKKRYLIRAPKQNIGNPYLVEQMGRFCTLIDDTSQFPFPQQIAAAFGKFFWIENCLNGPPTYAWQSLAEVSREWEKKGCGPLLTFSTDELAAIKRRRTELGVPPNAWHVCLHVRDSGYKQHHEDLHATLNADIRTYDLAIASVVKRGGWVIRMGDPSMPVLQKTKNVIDYAHSPQRSPEMDIFLAATCRFFIGTSSGPLYVPALYGIPSVITNWYPTGTRPLNSDDLFIPKLHWYDDEGEFAPFDESMSQPVGHIHAFPVLAQLGVSLRQNLREEIHDVVEEMLDRVDGGAEYTEEDRQLQSYFDAVARCSRSFGNARVGRNFLRKHQGLLPRALLNR